MRKISPIERREDIRRKKEERRKKIESEGKNKNTHLTPKQQMQMSRLNFADELNKRAQTFEKRGKSYFEYRNNNPDWYLEHKLHEQENER